MKHYFIIVLNLFFFLGYTQKLPDKLVDRPDGITIDYFDYSDQNNMISKKVFLGEKLKFKFPAYENYNRIDISEKNVEIDIIEKYLTAEIIESILNCCIKKNCPDTSKGYWLRIKNGNEIKDACIDYDFLKLELCGSENLKKIIDSFQNL